MSEQLARRIVEYLARPGGATIKPRRLARQLGVADADYGAFRRVLADLRRGGRIESGPGHAVRQRGGGRSVVGVFRRHARGFGFVTTNPPSASGDLHVPAGQTLDALTGDTVRCRVTSRGRRGGRPSFVGEVVEILERGQTQVVGRLHHRGDQWLAVPDGDKLHEPVIVGDVGAKNARSGDVVVVEIVQYAKASQPARGVVVERLGAHGQPGVDVLGVIRQYGIPDTFSDAALAEARAAAQGYDVDAALRTRQDLRDATIITIDPTDARDFDDAISLRRLSGGGGDGDGDAPARRRRRMAGEPAWELGVHIADVSHFIRPGGSLDAEARERGTSVYFPRHVVPMIPEVLSNGVCSLQEGQPRLCKSVFIQYDAAAAVCGARFANSVIASRRRLTYEEASAALEGRTGGIAGEVVELLREMERLARAIRNRRLENGMLVLDLPEVELVLDDKGRISDARPADTSFSHTLIEMFMVEANEAVARLLSSRGVPYLSRVHPEPEPEALEKLSQMLRGLELNVPRRPSREDLQRVLEAVRGKPSSYAVNLAVLRSMAQALYACSDQGHYALASEYYTHFTSPIRRYPDLHVHRLLQEYLEESAEHPRGGRRRTTRRAAAVEAGGLEDGDVAELGRHCSFTERRAQEAEREVRLVKVLELLSTQLGEVFDGVVSGVASFGVFVQHRRYLVDGLLAVQDLPDDDWQLDSAGSALVGRRTGRRFRIGDRFEVAIARVDVPSRRLALALVQAPPRGATPAPAQSPPRGSARGATRKPERRPRGNRARGGMSRRRQR